MEEFKGTPGVWGVSHGSASDSSTACIEITSTESLHEVAYLQSTPSNIGSYEPTSFERTIANAHLIAAAPDLLEALHNMVEAYQHEASIDNPALLEARAAIAKALGK
ncbi:hypothetical protein [Citrobacter sp. CK202]|uniref:hypothetical protein n=1 Tax=Citrobacter sp. CK202 TaxID=2985111 RepID=UPI00257829CF|nr:hypothetical protein [Citrobacter sp. CK202]MDM2960398.1 hypothetical protein [Citrobacter sp. CK202]